MVTTSSSTISVEVKNGVVRLTGTTATGARRLEAAVLARSANERRTAMDGRNERAKTESEVQEEKPIRAGSSFGTGGQVNSTGGPLQRKGQSRCLANQILRTGPRDKTTLLRNGQWEGELIDRRKDGSLVVVQSRWVVQRSFSGAPSDVRRLNQDVSAVKQREEAARESERLALLGTMAGVFAHEVANPLNGLSSALQFVQSALERKEFDAPVRAVIHGALREIDRLGSLLTDFRGIAHPRLAALKRTDLVKNVQEVLACQLEAYRALGITVKLQFNNPLPPVMADADKIKQVILNLCKNAVEAMPDGGCLILRGYHSDQMVVLEISDSGAGIPEGVNIFELFKTTKPDGSGLGLPLVQQIVSAHNGTIEYATEPSRGTTFKIYLPVAHNAQGSRVRETHQETTRKQNDPEAEVSQDRAMVHRLLMSSD
jgi:signal transduction histidine kinase